MYPPSNPHVALITTYTQKEKLHSDLLGKSKCETCLQLL